MKKLLPAALSFSALLGTAAVASAPQDQMTPPANTGTNTGAGAGASATPAWPSRVNKLSVGANQHIDVNGNLATGQQIAKFELPGHCIGEASQNSFAAKHVLYGFTLPVKTDVTVRLIPKTGAALGIYAYTLPLDRFDLPTSDVANNRGAVCKTSLPARTGLGEIVRGADRTITFGGTESPKNVIIGVSAPAGVTDADYTLAVDTQPE